jgi:N-acyl-D-aspartate/D-glutamate deacylase
MSADHADVLITRARIVDGTGAPARDGDVAIVDGRIREVRPGEEPPAHVARRIDARNRVVARGSSTSTPTRPS